MPPEQFLALSKANYEWAKRLRDAGRVEVSYALADHAGGFMGGFGVINYDSAEQLAEDLATMPVAGLSTIKVHPLVGLEVVERFIEAGLQGLPKK